MIMSNKVNFIFRGSPILPAGSSPCKSLFSAWTWHSVHFKLLAKLSKNELSQSCIKISLLKMSKIQQISKNVMSSSSVLSPGSTNSATLVVTRKSPESKPSPDPSPTLQTWVGDWLQGLYATMLGGTPPVHGGSLHSALFPNVLMLLHLSQALHSAIRSHSPDLVPLLGSGAAGFVYVVCCYVRWTADSPGWSSSCFPNLNTHVKLHSRSSGRCADNVSDGCRVSRQPSDPSFNLLSLLSLTIEGLHDLLSHVLRCDVGCCEALL